MMTREKWDDFQKRLQVLRDELNPYTLDDGLNDGYAECAAERIDDAIQECIWAIRRIDRGD